MGGKVRLKQKGVGCSVGGCDNWCVSNGMCAKHDMRERRKQERYREYTREYNKRYKRPDVEKVCKLCEKGFVTARKTQVFCSGCSGGKEANYELQKAHRAKHPERARARDIVSKRIKRGVSLEREVCEVCFSEGAEAHHGDYDKPLDIVWLCKEHHLALHKFESTVRSG